MRQDAFAGYHPALNFGYLAAVIALGLSLQHPAYGAVSLAGGLAYALMAGGRKGAGFALMFALPILVLTAILNPLFVHQGVTILFYLGNNPVTQEAIWYGLTRGLQFSGSLLWFYCYSHLMTGDKFAHLFGRVFPSGSLVFTMVLGFVPRFSKRLARIAEAQRLLSPPASSGAPRAAVGRGVRILSTMTTWSLENAVDTSDSMRSRGYGLPGRSRYMPYRWTRRDLGMSALLALLAGMVLLGAALGEAHFVCYPILALTPVTGANLIYLLGYGALCFAPVLMNLTEALQWKRIKSAA